MDQRKGISRRLFLQRATTIGAAAAVPGLLAACGSGVEEGAAPTATGGTTPAGTPTGAATTPAATASVTETATETGTESPTAAAGEPLKIGLLIPTGGVYSSLGEDMRNGFQLYLDQHDGALGGRPVEVIEEDSEANPEVGLRKAQKLLNEDRVAMVTGIVSSAVALGVRDLFHEAQVPLIISNAGANDITRAAKSPYIFRTSFSNWQSTYSLGQWAYDNVAQEGMYVIAPDYAAGAEDIAAFRESFEAAGGTVLTGGLPPFGTTQDYQPFLSEIGNAGAQAVFAFFAGGEAITFVQQYRDFGLKDTLPLIGPGFLTDEGVLEAQGDAALGLRTSLHYTPLLDNPTNSAYVEAYEAAYGEQPTVYTVQSYDAAQLIDLALGELGGDTADVDALVDAMANIGALDSPRGPFEMDPVTHNPIQNFYLREVQEVDGGLGNAVLEDLGPFPDPG